MSYIILNDNDHNMGTGWQTWTVNLCRLMIYTREPNLKPSGSIHNHRSTEFKPQWIYTYPQENRVQTPMDLHMSTPFLLLIWRQMSWPVLTYRFPFLVFLTCLRLDFLCVCVCEMFRFPWVADKYPAFFIPLAQITVLCIQLSGASQCSDIWLWKTRNM